ncbi:MAG: hypothetical protein WD431_05785 [Cyclobacteriaceae bacterium]
MRQKIAIGILLIFCFAEIRPLLPFVEYCATYEYISEVLCVNKDKPISTCNGKCYLSQQLEKAQETEKKDKSIPTVEQERIPMIICELKFPNFTVGNSFSQKFSAFYQFSIKDLSITPPTPPPKC